MTHHTPLFRFDNSYARDLDGFYVPWEGDKVPEPRIVLLNAGLAHDLGLDPDALDTDEGAAIFSGAKAPEGANTLAQAYAGHQFGGFSPQLGDGRAILLGEIIGPDGQRRDIHLKGSGRTPFSRGGDGKAVLAPVLREFLIGEAMHALHIPTTRALAATTTGEMIHREGPKPGAVLARVAASHLRVGTFQFFAARGEHARVRQLADYAIARHDPSLADAPDKYLAFLNAVIRRQATLLAKWMHVGFVHGVMNTDNTTISGETIDYGPCAFIDAYDPKAVFSSIDRQGRYAYGNQPVIAQWNLARLAETLIPHLHEDQDEAIRIATEAVQGFTALYMADWVAGMRPKLGLNTAEDSDTDLANGFYAAMEGQGVDHTQAFRALTLATEGNNAPLRDLFDDPSALDAWLPAWQDRLARDPAQNRAAAMNAVNPVYIPRNHLVESALQAAERDGDMTEITTLLEVLRDPFTARDGLEDYAQPAPDGFGPYTTFCGT
ncbi:YdiU family protein [Primorskyibacter aestuariivivens]|uniref:protein adenylyltransferase SelO n=1 Tax=Primorskyibacter aestuariivivens TaxID=1888912 RepID=UPI0023014353|nr:YdiU family protein [Primorskyibacter aestuariivivens]MDA7429293.1 YdiU family protein [Primorskyibacter aestuariivivens]